jgi:hypothetical protein
LRVCPASCDEERNVKATFAPERAIARAMALPRRRAPPVMRTVLPFNSLTVAL